MAEGLVNVILDLFGNLTSLKYGKEWIVFIISMMPILELRGGLAAAALFGINIWKAVILCIVGNIIPVPFILWFITPIFTWMKKTILPWHPAARKSRKKSMTGTRYWQDFWFAWVCRKRLRRRMPAEWNMLSAMNPLRPSKSIWNDTGRPAVDPPVFFASKGKPPAMPVV